MSGVSFGGRLRLVNDRGPHSASAMFSPLRNRRRMIIFQTPPAHLRTHMGSGRGKLWIGSRTCQGSGLQPGYCPWTEDRPCLDTGIPCETAPSYSPNKLIQFFDVTPTSINVTWPAWDQATDLGSGPISEYQIQFREAQQTEFRTISMGTSLSYLFENLREDTDYEFRVVIFRDHATHGEGPPSSVQTQRTLPKRQPPSYIQSDPLEFSAISGNSCTVSWPAWDETTGSGVGPITGYKILYRQLGGIFQEVLLDGNSLSHRFDGLTGRTTYEFQIILVRDEEPTEGQPSQIQTVTTEQAKCGELGHVNLNVETMALAEAEFSRFIVSWQLHNLTENCNLTHQQISNRQLDIDSCRAFPPKTKPKEPSVLDIGKRTKSFKRLSPNSLFKITYLARNPVGTKVTSQIHRTAEAVPSGGPGGLRAVTKRNRISFFWSKPPCGERNGEIIRYEYVASKNGNPVTGERMSPAPARYQMRQLPNGDRWLFKVKACTGAGCGPYAQTSGIID